MVQKPEDSMLPQNEESSGSEIEEEYFGCLPEVMGETEDESFLFEATAAAAAPVGRPLTFRSRGPEPLKHTGRSSARPRTTRCSPRGGSTLSSSASTNT